MSKKQTNLFNNIKSLKHDIEFLSAYAQNDFQWLLDNNYTTKEGLKASNVEIEKEFNAVIRKLMAYKKELMELVEKRAS